MGHTLLASIAGDTADNLLAAADGLLIVVQAIADQDAEAKARLEEAVAAL